MATRDNKTRPRPDLRLARALAALISLTMFAIGIYAITAKHYYGYTSKFGGAEVILNGSKAQAAGLMFVVLGALPLALWCRTPRAAAWWGSGWAVVFIGLLGFWLYG